MGSFFSAFLTSITATRTEPLGRMNSATGPSAAMDSQTFTNSLREAFGKYNLSEASDLIQRNRHQFQAEAKIVLGERIFEEQVLFGWIAQLTGFDNIDHVLSELITTAFTGKLWHFVGDGVLSTRASLVINYVKEKKPDLYEFVFHCNFWKQVGSATLSRLFELLIEAGLYDTLKEIVVSCWEFDEFDYPPLEDFFIWVLQQLVNGKKLWKAFECFRKDCRDCCQYVATFLALHLKEWKLAADILKTGAVKYMRGPKGALVSVLTDKAWDCSVLILYSVMCVHSSCKTEVIGELEVQYCQYWKSHPEFLKPFVQMSKKMNLHAAGALLATWLNMWEVVKDLLHDLHRGRDDNANISVLTCVLRKRQFRIVYDWLHEPAQSSLQPICVYSLLIKACDSCEICQTCEDTEASPLAELLMGRCLDGCALGRLLVSLNKPNRSHCLHRFVAEGLLTHCSIASVEGALFSLIRIVTLKDFNYFEQARVTLLLFIEAGVVCPHNPFPYIQVDWTTINVDMSLICLLYETGIMSSENLGALLQGFKDGKVQVPEGEEAACRSYLEQVTNTPRTLENACCIYLSRALGYGADRKQRALALGLPPPLVREVLFQQALTHAAQV